MPPSLHKESNSSSHTADDEQRPRDAATLVIVDRSFAEPKVLMGQRRSGQVFMPNKFVFPGGRVDDEDRNIKAGNPLDQQTMRQLLHDMKGNPSAQRAHGIAIAALRETYEEAGIVIGTNRTQSPDRNDSGTSETKNTSTVENLPGYAAEGLQPDLANLRFFARAITPPGRTRRYDTRFFTIDAKKISQQVPPPDDELRNLDWFSRRELDRLDLPDITRRILSELNAREIELNAGRTAPPAPYFFFKSGQFHRQLIKS